MKKVSSSPCAKQSHHNGKTQRQLMDLLWNKLYLLRNWRIVCLSAILPKPQTRPQSLCHTKDVKNITCWPCPVVDIKKVDKRGNVR